MRTAVNLVLAVAIAGCTVLPASRAPLSGEPVADGVSLLPGRFVPGTQPDGNTLLLRGDRGLVVVDSGRHAGHAGRILAAARASGLPVEAIVNTHWHLDHVAGNVALRDAYPQAPVLASDAIDDALHGFLADYRAQLQGLVDRPGDASAESVSAWRHEIARIDAGERLRPTRLVAGTEDAMLAGRRVRLEVERNAASGGDVWLFDQATRTLVVGDLVTLPVPLFDTACIAGWQRALQRLETIGFERLVPGHGAVMDRAGFATYRAAFDRLLACAATDASTRTCKAGWRHDARTLIPAGDAALADTLLDYYITQVLRAPPERRDRHCRRETRT